MNIIQNLPFIVALRVTSLSPSLATNPSTCLTIRGEPLLDIGLLPSAKCGIAREGEIENLENKFLTQEIHRW